ncbi:phage tail sheath C-terminal domain-containing protein [Streptomyces sp. ODS28]|uniref:phage tail sheath C-terminal domain-containing protein n=1 Tax=Streptomyces sp. ODS28 TaxID=3136688 RepID=UPI0031EE5FE9
MAVNVSYPGVYIDELPSSVRTITGVSTAVAAFVGPAIRGPVDRPRAITNWSDFVRIYGDRSDRSLMSYAVLHYFQNGGSAAEIVRVAPTARAAVIELTDKIKLRARAVGAEGNKLRARVNYPADPKMYVLRIKKSDGTPSEYTVKADAKADEDGSLWKVLAADDQAPVVPASGNQPGKPPETSQPAAAGDEFGVADVHKGVGGRDGAEKASLRLPMVDPQAPGEAGKTKYLPLRARDPGAWGNELTAEVDHATGDPGPGEAGKLYNLTVRDDATGAEEIFRNIVADRESPRSPVRALEASQLVAAASAVGAKEDLFVRPDETKENPVKATGGSDGPAVDDTDLRGSDGVARSGIPLLRETDLFTMLCVPPVARDAALSDDLLLEAAALCTERRAVLLIDAPYKWTSVDDAAAGVGALRNAVGSHARNTAVYFPWLRMEDAHGGLTDFPPCGVLAGVWARTDGERNVAKAPAGTEASLNGVAELAVKMTDSENGRLNPLAVNCLRTLPGAGTVAWGSRTLRGADRLADQWKYLPVRRTALFIEESLYRGTQWVVFEPNDEPLWAAIRLNVGAFMNTLFRQGLFKGSTPQQAYLVKCDGENNPQNDIDRGIVNILVGFAPLKPAEFVIVHIQQISPALQV